VDEELEDLKTLAKNLEEENRNLLAQARQTVGAGPGKQRCPAHPSFLEQQSLAAEWKGRRACGFLPPSRSCSSRPFSHLHTAPFGAVGTAELFLQPFSLMTMPHSGPGVGEGCYGASKLQSICPLSRLAQEKEQQHLVAEVETLQEEVS
jgi:hypothetical protein